MTLLRITQSDAQRRTGRTPRTQGEYRRAMENMGEVLIVRAIMGSTGIPPTTYEVRERERQKKRDGPIEVYMYVPQSVYNFSSFVIFFVGLA